MSVREIVDAVFRLLEILISWPVILLVVILLVRNQLPEVVATLAQRITKGPFGTEFAQLQEKVDTIATTVKQIEEKITFVPSTALTPNLEQELNAAFSSFRAYVQELGFKPEESEERIYIDPEPKFSGSYYDYSQHLVVISADLASDKDFALREYTNHALLLIAKVDIAEWSTACQEFESGLAYYFPCSFQDNPLFAPTLAKKFPDQYIWNLNNDQKFTRLRSSFRINGDLQGEVWGAAFWEMRELLGQSPADKLLFTTWSALQPSDLSNKKRIHFASRLLEIAADGSGEHVQQIQAIFERRGLKF